MYQLTRAIFVFIVLAGFQSQAVAHENKVSQTVEIAAPADQVWATVGNFHAIHEWLPGVQETVSDGSSEPGAKRELVLGETVSLHEVLDTLDPAQMTLGYSIPDDTHDTAVLPVKGYSSMISVLDAGGTSIVTWTGRFFAADGKTDNEVVGVIDGLYKAGLANLKSMLE